ncbi:MAG: hypothetical protein ABSB82_23415 [Terriglobia bacterium]|jgi:hypothetical protein
MADSRISTLRLILIPSVITLAVTLLRMVGELEGWSKTFFSPAPGGGAAVVGIVWLVPIFGIYFALKLAGAGERPASSGRAIVLALVGFLLLATGFVLLNFVLGFHFRYLLLMWLLAVVGAALQFFAWPVLARVLLAYGYAARIPVAVVMYIATQNVWESHYNAIVVPESRMGVLEQYVLFGLIPQLVWWICFTIVVGALIGSVAVAFARRGKAAVQAES